MSLAFREKFRLGVAVWLSLFLSIPLTDALGYSGQGWLLRLTIIAGMTMAAWLAVAFPVTVLAVAGAGVIAAALLFLFSPSVALSLALNLLRLAFTDANFRFSAVLAAVALTIFLMLRLPRRLSELGLFLGGMGLIVSLWYLYIDSAYASALLYLPAWLLWLAYGHGDRLLGRAQPGDRSELHRHFVRYSAAILTTVVAVTFVLPKDFSSVQWRGLQIWGDRYLPFLADLRGGETFDIRGDGAAFGVSVAGFGDGVRLGGSVIDDPTVLLEVTRGRSDYLRGSVWQEYTGSTWSEVGEIAPWAPSNAPDSMRALLRSVQLEINHRRLRTVTVFTLPYTQSIILEGRPLYMSPGYSVISTEEVPRNTPYTVRGMVMAYRGAFAELEAREQHAELGAWLTLPDTLTPQVRQLAASIAGPHAGDYAKMEALESYLRLNYEYSKIASPLPEGADFVHFFLFEEQKGYCTSFASALAVMGRAVGVPTRYVQGFRMPEKADQDGVYRVTGTDAHAWVEAYIGGLGWVLFEPTPAFPTSLSLPLQASPGEVGGGTAEPGPVIPPEREPNFWDEFPFITDPGAPPPEIPPIATTTVRYVPVTLILLVFFVSFWRWRGLHKSLGRVDSLPAGHREIAYYNLTLALLAAMGLAKRPDETPREYGLRINRDIYDWRLDFRRLSEGVSDCLYGKGELPFDTFPQESREFFYSVLRRFLVVSGRIRGYAELYGKQRYLSRQLFSTLLD